MPRALVYFVGRLNKKGVSILFFHLPNHIASVLVLLISRSEHEWNSFKKRSRLFTESRSRTNTVPK